MWQRVSKAAKLAGKWIVSREWFENGKAYKPRGQKQKTATWNLKQQRRSKVREVKSILGRRLTSDEMKRYIPRTIRNQATTNREKKNDSSISL